MSEIIVNGAKIKDQRVINSLRIPNEYKKYIKSSEMFIEYDAEIYANESILNIPLIATVIPLAWLTGADIQVAKLDKTFKESMDQLQNIFKKMLPLAPFKTQILTEELVDNKNELEDPKRDLAQLFSGGIDATYSLITNLNKKPRLIMHWGVERTPYPVYSEYWEMVRSTYDAFAKKHGLTYHLTKTNALEITHYRKIEHSFYKQLYYGSLWSRLQHSLVLLSLAAPLSVRRFNKLLIAASRYPEHPKINKKYHPTASQPLLDEKIVWSDLEMKHDGFIRRNNKTRAIADYLKNDQLTLRVCLDRDKAPHILNCSDCPKCFRTIAQLVQAETDPNKVGFVVDSSTFERMKLHFTNNGLGVSDTQTHQMIPDDLEYDLYGSKEFFTWFRDLKPKKKDVWKYRKLYLAIPYSLAKIINKAYICADIKIHEHDPYLPDDIISNLEAISHENID